MDGLKQRVIGALVLVSLAVIFVPMLFDEPHSKRSTQVIPLPEEPPFPEVEPVEEQDIQQPSYYLEEADGQSQPEPIIEPVDDEPQGVAAKSNTAEPVAESVNRTPEPAPQPEPTPEPEPVQAEVAAEAAPKPSQPAAEPPANEEYSRSLEGAWVVQLGSFGNADNARRLRDNARKEGYSSHLQTVSRGDSTLTRVFCGPFADKSEAERAKKALDGMFGLNSLITSSDR